MPSNWLLRCILLIRFCLEVSILRLNNAKIIHDIDLLKCVLVVDNIFIGPQCKSVLEKRSSSRRPWSRFTRSWASWTSRASQPVFASHFGLVFFFASHFGLVFFFSLVTFFALVSLDFCHFGLFCSGHFGPGSFASHSFCSSQFGLLSLCQVTLDSFCSSHFGPGSFASHFRLVFCSSHFGPG